MTPFFIVPAVKTSNLTQAHFRGKDYIADATYYRKTVSQLGNVGRHVAAGWPRQMLQAGSSRVRVSTKSLNLLHLLNPSGRINPWRLFSF
jgi:hypothetical protein